MTTITLPTTVEAMVTSLDGLEALLTAKGWERAAIVYAFTEPEQGRRSDLGRNGPKLTVSDFTALGIVGLKKRDTVRHYRKLWAEYGDPAIVPGDEVTLPDLPFPPHEKQPNGRVSTVPAKAVAKVVETHGVEVIAETVAADEELRLEVVREMEHVGVLNEVLTEVKEAQPTKTRTPKPKDWDADVIKAVSTIAQASTARREGKWEPSPMTDAAFHWLTQLLLGLDLSPDSDLLNMDDIYDFLKAAR